MESDHEFTVQLAGEGIYAIKLLESVQIERRDDVIIGRWPAFNLQAKGANEADVYQGLLGGLQQQMGAGRLRLSCGNTARGCPTRMLPRGNWRNCARSPSAGASPTTSNTWSGCLRTPKCSTRATPSPCTPSGWKAAVSRSARH